MRGVYRSIAPILRLLPPESAHRLTLRALAWIPLPAPTADDPILGIRLWGRDFPNPVGLAAGFCAAGATALAPLADYLAINVSSPNTPGLRALQGRDPLTRLIGAVQAARAAATLRNPPPLLLKIAPDLTEADRRDIAEVALATGIDGLIEANTTLPRRPRLPRPAPGRRATSPPPPAPPLPLVGVGGIAGGADAYAKIRAGASLVQ